MSTPDLPEDASSASPEPQNGDLDEEFDMVEIKEAKGEGDGSPATNSSNGHKPSSNAKDPLRPRRKKARRACFACQRAHLTCGMYALYLKHHLIRNLCHTVHCKEASG